ncbi:MAG: AAC(3) family N-acetyltransferase [Anaerolineaceae bacterium]|nr:AAC(3) family N-acetyltransferase [Anaerolineaceae bacterium]
MTEADAIQQSSRPVTRASLATDLRTLGLDAGMTVMVHSSLSKLGWVCGGPIAVVQALMDVISPLGTLIMPTHSGDLSEPSYWVNPPVPAEWIDEIHATMPAYDARITPTRGMGRIVEVLRTCPDVLRSNHSSMSFAAWGQHAEFVTNGHQMDYSLGEGSPLARLYDLDGWLLFLGVSHGNNTSFHLAEARCGKTGTTQQGGPVMDNGQRVWKVYQDFDYNDESFPEIGAEYEKTHPVQIGRVGYGEARLLKQRPAVDFAEQWMREKR